MNKQELVALFNEKFKGKKYPSWPDPELARAVNTAMGLSQANSYENAFSGSHDNYAHTTFYLEFRGYRVARINAHKKKGMLHGRWYGTYCDWTFKEFSEEDVEIFNGNTLEEAKDFALQCSNRAKQHKDDKLRMAREAMDLLATRYNLDDSGVVDLCMFIKDNSYALRAMAPDAKKNV